MLLFKPLSWVTVCWHFSPKLSWEFKLSLFERFSLQTICSTSHTFFRRRTKVYIFLSKWIRELTSLNYAVKVSIEVFLFWLLVSVSQTYENPSRTWLPPMKLRRKSVVFFETLLKKTLTTEIMLLPGNIETNPPGRASKLTLRLQLNFSSALSVEKQIVSF